MHVNFTEVYKDLLNSIVVYKLRVSEIVRGLLQRLLGRSTGTSTRSRASVMCWLVLLGCVKTGPDGPVEMTVQNHAHPHCLPSSLSRPPPLLPPLLPPPSSPPFSSLPPSTPPPPPLPSLQ